MPNASQPLRRLLVLLPLAAALARPSLAQTGDVDRRRDCVHLQLPVAEASAALAGWEKRSATEIVPAVDARLLNRLRALAHKRGIDATASAPLDRLERWTRVRTFGRDATAELAPFFGLELLEPVYRHWTASLPNDPLLASQTYVPLLGMSSAFDVVRGDQAPVLVGVVDAGTDWRHVDLRSNIFERPEEIEGNGVDDDSNGFVDDVRGWNFANDSNDPTGLPTTPLNAQHGTHIAGIIGAVSDNGIGISGVSWNARLLPVNVGTADPAADRSIDYAYEGLLYAAASGVDIINVSWGRSSGRWSDYEHDVLLAIESIGVLVVAAAGNQLELAPFYPAYYPSVLSVTRVGLDLTHHFSANHDTWIDLSAPGSRILSTVPGDAYGLLDGTSQAAALVSGIAALLCVQQPHWQPAQLRQQLRWTAADISAWNPGLELELGTGLVDPTAALTETPPGLEISQLRLASVDGGGLPTRGELVGVYFELHNHLQSSGSVRIELTNRHPSLLEVRDDFLIGAVAAGQTLTVQPGLLLWADDDAPIGELGDIVLQLQVDGRRVHQGFSVEPIPAHIELSGRGIEFTHTNNGRLAYLQPLRARDPGGRGIGRPGMLTQVQLGSLLVGVDGSRVADALSAPNNLQLFGDFRPPFVGSLELTPEGASSTFTDFLASPRVGVRVVQRSILFEDLRRGDAAISVYELTPSLGDWSGARAGLLIDFEMRQPGQPEHNRIHFDAQRALLWAEDESQTRELIGVCVLEAPGAVGWTWLRDLRPEADDGRPYLFDGADLSYSPSEAVLWYLLSRHEPSDASESAGVAGVLHCGPFDRTMGEPARLVVAWLMASDEAALAAAAGQAKQSWAFLREGLPILPAARLALLPNLPNPFNPRTEIRFTLDSQQRAQLLVFDARGRLVRNLLNQSLLSGYHRVTWDGRDDLGESVGSGVYRVLLRGVNESDQQSVVLVR